MSFFNKAGRSQQGFSLIEVLVVIVIIGLLAMIAIPKFSEYRKRANRTAIIVECRQLYTAFATHQQSAGAYPDSASFDLQSFEPLRTSGYYSGNLHNRLLANQADAYDAPNASEFWIIMTQKDDVMNQFLVADSDEVPLAPGQNLQGIFWIYNGTLQNQL